MRKVKVSLRHEFTREELDSKRDELAQVTIDAGVLKDKAKNAAAAAKENFDILDGRRKFLSRQIVARGEERETDCVVRYNVPRPGLKQTIRIDTGEVVHEGDPMDYDERQKHLFKDAELEELERMYGGDGPDHEMPAPTLDGKTAAAGDDTLRITEVPEGDTTGAHGAQNDAMLSMLGKEEKPKDDDAGDDKVAS